MAPKRAASKKRAPKRGAVRGARREHAAERPRSADARRRGGAPPHPPLARRAGVDSLPLTARPRHRADGATCRLLRDAARLAFKARPYIGKVVSLCHKEKFAVAAHQGDVHVRGGAADDRFITGSMDRSIKVWRSLAEPKWSAVGHLTGKRSVCAHPSRTELPSPGWRCSRAHGARFVSGSATRHREAVDARRRSRAHHRRGRLRVVRRSAARRRALCGRPWRRRRQEVKLYHVDGTLVHTFKGHPAT